MRKRKSSTPLNPTFKGDTSYLVSILFTRVKITRQWKSTLYRLNSSNAFRTRVSFRVLLSRDFSRFPRVSLMGNVDIAH